MSKNCQCTRCEKVYEAQPIIKQYPQDVERVYLECPHCGHQETAYYTDKRIRKLQHRIAALNRPGFIHMAKEKREAEIAEKKALLAELMGKLRKKYGD